MVCIILSNRAASENECKCSKADPICMHITTACLRMFFTGNAMNYIAVQVAIFFALAMHCFTHVTLKEGQDFDMHHKA